MSRTSSGAYVIDIRDQRLDGGRLKLSSRTTHRPTYRRREAALRRLIEDGEMEIIRRLRGRELHISEVQAAVEAGDLDRLRRGDDAESLTLGAAADRLQRTVEATRADSTARQYDIVLRMMKEKFGEDTPLAQIGSSELEDWIHGPQTTTGGKPWSHARQALAMAIAGRLWNVTIRKEEEYADRVGAAPRIRRNPVKNVERPSDRQGRVEFLHPKEWRTLASKVEGRAVAVLLGLGCLAGLRISEAAHLRPGIDVILDADVPVIKVQPRDGEYPWRPKTKRSIRTVPIGAELLAMIRTHIELGYAGDRYLIRVPGKDRPLARQTLADWTAAAFREAGIRYGRKKDALTHHSLRHTFISWLVQEDVSLKKIEKLAGTSVRMILEVYGHLIDEDLERAVAIVDRKAQEG